MKRSYSLLLGFFCLFFFHAVLGQQKKDGIDSFFPRYLTFSFNSEILKEKRTFIINLPEGYSESNEENYPVVYLLDAENNFPFTSSLIEKLRSRAIPKSILVGIINTNRTRDLTPIHSINPQENGITKGGADNFRQMLVDELIPYVEKKFRTNNFKTLIGHSYGGLFIVNTLSNAQELFNAYICISPSLWWDKQKEVDLFEDYIRSEKEMNSILYLTMANEEGAMRGGLLKLIGILETENPENLRWAYNILPDENHGSIIIPSQIEGFNFIYKDWYVSNVKEEFEKNGLEGFELREQRIFKEFNTKWKLDNMKYSTLLNSLHKEKDFTNELRLSRYLIDQGEEVANFYLSAASSNINLKQPKNAKDYLKKAYELNPGYKKTIMMMDTLLIPRKKYNKTAGDKLKKYVGTYKNGRTQYDVSISKGLLYLKANDRFFKFSKNLNYMKHDTNLIPNDRYLISFIVENDTTKYLKITRVDGWMNRLKKVKLKD